MKIENIILKKENKEKLSFEEIEFAVKNYLSGKISKIKMTNLLKLISKNGMSQNEIFYLTKIMTNSGKTLEFPKKNKIYADKHSTGGVSDSTTLIIAPIIACAGIGFLKMSGRKLGHTGGTADKLECFEGYKVNLSLEEAEELVAQNGAALITQTDDLAPADKYIYKLRDETNTITSIPLIASSIMSKKLASGNDVIVLDVKCGNGAFMKTQKDAKKLAKLMVKIGINADKKISAVISDMNQPLGHCVGSLVETIEAISVLKGEKSRLRELSVFLAGKIIELSKNIPFKKSEKLALNILNSGKALTKLKNIIKVQGGSLNLFDDKYTKNILKNPITLLSKKEGYLSKFDLEILGNLTREYCSLGNSGIKVLVNLGDFVTKNSPVLQLYGEKTDLDFISCFHFSKNKKTANNLIIDVL